MLFRSPLVASFSQTGDGVQVKGQGYRGCAEEGTMIVVLTLSTLGVGQGEEGEGMSDVV